MGPGAKHTLGGSKSCEVLYELLLTSKYKSKVITTLKEASTDLHQLSNIEDNGVRHRIFYILRDHYLNIIDKMKVDNLKINTFARNVLIQRFRNFLNAERH